jgi:hypothetical protein
VKHDIPHDLSPEIAKKAVERAFESYQARFSEYNPSASWSSPTNAAIGFKVKGMALDGNIELVPGKIVLNLDVPFLLRPFQKKAVDIIDQEVRSWIARAQRGEI